MLQTATDEPSRGGKARKVEPRESIVQKLRMPKRGRRTVTGGRDG